MIYVIGEQRSGVVKIGTAVDPEARLKAIQAGNHRPLQVLVTLPGGRREESDLHRTFTPLCVGGEWFDFGEQDPVTAVAAALDAPRLPERKAAVGPRSERAIVRPSREPAQAPNLSPPLRITVIGCKGGVGASTVAMMLGFVMADSRKVTVYDASATRTPTTWAESWDGHLALTVKRGLPERTPIGGEAQIVDLGRWAEGQAALPQMIGGPGLVVLVTTPGVMELHHVSRALDDLLASTGEVGVLISHSGEVDDRGRTVACERAFREGLVEAHPDAAVFRDAIPARHPKHGADVSYADWYACAPVESETWSSSAFSRVARDIVDAGRRSATTRVA